MDGRRPRSLQDRLNEWANAVFQRRGYSPQRTRDAKREAWWWLSARSRAIRGRRLFAGSAVVWTHPGRCELLPIEQAGPAASEVTIEIAASVVSTGTERAVYSGGGAANVRFPYRPGYSSAGVVIATGRRTKLRVGDRVAAPVSHSSVATVAAVSAYPVPDGVPLDDAAFVQLGVIARHGVLVAGIRPGEPVCVIGTGVIGSLALRLAVAAGAGPVTAVARTRRREQVARAGGAGSFRALSEGDGLEDVAAAVVIDATGDPSAVVDAVAAARDGGRVVILGSPRGATHDFPLALIGRKGVTLVGAHVSTLGRNEDDRGLAFRREAIAFLDQLASGAVVVSDLVDVELDPREAPAFYRGLPAADVTAARLDWTRLDSRDRRRAAHLLHPPRIASRGVDFGENPIVLRKGESRQLVDDPLGAPTGLLRIGLVGCGEIGIQNADAIASAPNTRLVACFDPVPALAAEVAGRHRAAAADSFDALLDRADVDAVVVAVPHDLHAPLVIAAAETGRHVIVEKPLAHTLASALEIAGAVERAGVAATVCFPHRYAAGVLAARRLIDEGALGELQGTLTAFLADKPPSYWHSGYSGRATSDWRSLRARSGGGVLIMNLSHFVDLVLHLGRVPVESVTAVLSRQPSGGEVEDSISVSILYANGAVGTLFGGASVPGTWEGRTSTELRLWGSDGHVAVEGRREVFSLRAAGGLRPGRWHSLDGAPAVPLRAAFMSRFATAVDQGLPPDVGIADALAVQAFVEAAYRSAAEGRGVRPAELMHAERPSPAATHEGVAVVGTSRSA